MITSIYYSSRFKKQRGIDLSSSTDLIEIVPSKEKEAENRQEDTPLPKTNPEEDMYESELVSRVDDETLRHVFSGFCQADR